MFISFSRIRHHLYFWNNCSQKFFDPCLGLFSTHWYNKIILLMYGNFFYFANWNMKIILLYRVMSSFQLQWGVHFLFFIQIHYWLNFLFSVSSSSMVSMNNQFLRKIICKCKNTMCFNLLHYHSISALYILALPYSYWNVPRITRHWKNVSHNNSF